jgi:hypothetical protein
MVTSSHPSVSVSLYVFAVLGLQADRMRTQAELQRAQERATSLQEDLALIRSTLLPLAQQQSTPPKKSSLAALTAMQQHQLMQERQAEQQTQAGLALSSPGPKLAGEDSLYLDDCDSPEGGYITAVHPSSSRTPCKGRMHANR